MTYRELAKQVTEQLVPLYGTQEATAIQRFLFVEFGKRDISSWLMLYDEQADAEFIDFITQAVKELLNHKPVQYILGTATFMDMEFEVTPEVLIPRPETEELVRRILDDLDHQKFYKILDVGTGSGIIAVSLAKKLPLSEVTAIDISIGALEVAKRNAMKNKVSVHFKNYNILQHLPDEPIYQSETDRDLLLPVEDSRGSMVDSPDDNLFDIIVSNPPYIKLSEMELMSRNVLDYEPHNALFVTDEDPLIFYRAIISFANFNLKSDGYLYFEINEYESQKLQKLLVDTGYLGIEIYNDINEKPRIVKASKKRSQ